MFKIFLLICAIAYTTALTTVSLMTLRNLPDIGVSFGDKIFHFLAYAVLTILWTFVFFYNFNYIKKKAIGYAFVISVSFGIFIEVVQGTATVARSFDVYDMLANTCGALLAVGILSIYSFKHIKKL